MFSKIGLLFLGIAASSSFALDVATLFQVDVSTTANGGCLNPGRDTLNNRIADSLTLANSGVDLLNAYTTNEAAERLVDSFFKQPGIGLRENIANNYKAVANFLSSNTGGPAGDKPWLFCDSNWLTRTPVSGQPTLAKNAQAWDSNGHEHPVVDNAGNPVSIYSAYQTQWDAIAQALAPKKVFPYWSSRLSQYVLDGAYNGINNGYCSDIVNKGATQSQTTPNTITLCPVAYRTGGRVTNPGAIAAVPHAQIVNKIVAGVPQLGTYLNAADPVTLYHELFHLIPGVQKTPDLDNYDVGHFIDIAVPQAQAVVNPESYVAASYAWWLTKNVPKVNNQVIAEDAIPNQHVIARIISLLG